MAACDLQQDGVRYFDQHHGSHGGFDPIDSLKMGQNVAAWAVTLGAVANAPENMGLN